MGGFYLDPFGLSQQEQDPFLAMFQQPQQTFSYTPPPADLSNNFMENYGQIVNRIPPTESYFDTKDPDFLKYQELSAATPESEKMLAEYTKEREDIESKGPGFWRILAGSLAGMGTALAGGGGSAATNLASTIFNVPRMEALGEWEAKGKNIGVRARALDTARGRELGALRYGLQAKASARRAKSIDEFKREQEARRIADEITGEEERKIKLEDTRNQRDIINNMSREIFEQRKSMDEWRKSEALRDNTRMDEENKKRSERLAAEAASFENINKKLASYASQQGIQTSIMDERGRKTEMTARDIADEIAYKKAKANPAFADLLEETDEGWKFVEPEYGKDRIRILKNYLNSLSSKYLRGDF